MCEIAIQCKLPSNFHRYNQSEVSVQILVSNGGCSIRTCIRVPVKTFSRIIVYSRGGCLTYCNFYSRDTVVHHVEQTLSTTATHPTQGR